MLETNASISFGYDAARVSTSQTEVDLTARTDMKIIPYDKIKVNRYYSEFKHRPRCFQADRRISKLQASYRLQHRL